MSRNLITLRAIEQSAEFDIFGHTCSTDDLKNELDLAEAALGTMFYDTTHGARRLAIRVLELDLVNQFASPGFSKSEADLVPVKTVASIDGLGIANRDIWHQLTEGLVVPISPELTIDPNLTDDVASEDYYGIAYATTPNSMGLSLTLMGKEGMNCTYFPAEVLASTEAELACTALAVLTAMQSRLLHDNIKKLQ